MNLALGLAALMSFASAFSPLLVPSRWLLAPWLTASSTSTLSAFTVLAARIGVNLWLPASVFMVLFAVAGLHRKLGAPRAKLASGVLVFAWVTNVALTFVPAMIGRSEAAGALMFVLGMFLTPVYLLSSVAIVIAAAVEVTALSRYTPSMPARPPVALLLWAIVPPLLFMVPLLLAPSNPVATSAKETRDFAAMCKDVGVQLKEKPVAPARSIAYDWDRQRFKARPMFERIEMDANGRITGYGGFALPNSAEARKKLAFEFSESPPDRAGAATVNPTAPYYRFPDPRTPAPYYGVDTLSADVLAFLDVDKPGELSKPLVAQGAMRVTLTLTDRRSGAVLGVQTYVVDSINKRACGANVDNNISQDAFIYDAINR